MFRYHYNKVRRSNKTDCPSGISTQVRRFAIALARGMLPHRLRKMHYSAGGLIHQRSQIQMYGARALIHW